jgi:hypothetical protein
MTILILGAIALVLTIASQAWDDRERRKANTIAADLLDTEATCRAQQAKQAAYVQRHEDDPRGTAGKPITPASETRHRRAA